MSNKKLWLNRNVHFKKVIAMFAMIYDYSIMMSRFLFISEAFKSTPSALPSIGRPRKWVGQRQNTRRKTKKQRGSMTQRERTTIKRNK